MGQLLSTLFCDYGHTVILADIDTAITNVEAVKEADVIAITVPIASTIDVIKEVGPHCKKDALLFDVTSTKAEPIEAMLDYFEGSVIGTHPLFGPSVHSLQGQRIAVVCARDVAQWHKWLCNIFNARGLSILDTTAAEHDNRHSRRLQTAAHS